VTVKMPLLQTYVSYSKVVRLDALDTVGDVRLSGGGGVPAPKPGCFFVGTECRVGYQTCKYCCGGGNGQSYTVPCGWCIGWYDAPPCIGF